MAIAEGISTALLGRVLDSLNIGVVFVDRQNDIQVFNTTAGIMLEEDPVSKIGTSVLLCHPVESVPVVLQRIGDLISGRESMRENWLNYRGRQLREYILPVRDANGEAVGTLLLVHDAAEHVDCLKRLGEWADVRVSGLGDRTPRLNPPPAGNRQSPPWRQMARDNRPTMSRGPA